jgi:hypothetical protein
VPPLDALTRPHPADGELWARLALGHEALGRPAAALEAARGALEPAFEVLKTDLRFALPSLPVLHAAGATDDPSRATLTLRDPAGVEHTVAFAAGDHQGGGDRPRPGRRTGRFERAHGS